MDEKPDGNTRLLVPDHLWQQHEVIIVDPEDVPVSEDRENLFSIEPVDLGIGPEGNFAVGYIFCKIMEQGPDGVAGKTMEVEIPVP